MATSNQQQVNRILGCQNNFEVLQVQNDADEETIRLAYSELILLVHPDKNRPYLTENPDRKEEFTVACRKVITAKIALTTRNASEPHHADPAQPDDDTHNDVPNNDYHWKTSETNDSHQNWYNTKRGFYAFIFFPVIILSVGFLFMCASDAPKENYMFRFEQDAVYYLRRRCDVPPKKISYYVTQHFQAHLLNLYRGSIEHFEYDVKKAYQKKLHIKCNREKNKEHYLEVARISGNRKLYMEMMAPGTPSCDKLKHLNKFLP